jgi:hypothetical protein
MCSGQVYYDLLAAREERKIGARRDRRVWSKSIRSPPINCAISRTLSRRADVVWVQEEPRNMGAWRFVQEQLQGAVCWTSVERQPFGRVAQASPAGAFRTDRRSLPCRASRSLCASLERVECLIPGEDRSGKHRLRLPANWVRLEEEYEFRQDRWWGIGRRGVVQSHPDPPELP